MRQDMYLYSDSGTFAVYTLGLGGRDRANVADNLRGAVQDGLIVPLGLAQDDDYNVRLLVDEALTEIEAAEWVGRVDWFLRVADGKLALQGYFSDDFDQDYLLEDESLRIIDVPPGDYHVELYTYFPQLNAEYCLRAADDEPIGTWFRRTRPDDDFPDWLKIWLTEDEPEADPGHEDSWEAFAESDAYGELLDRVGDTVCYIDFLLRLTPLDEAETPFVLDDNTVDSGGWFLLTLNARKPERCPLGLIADLPPEPTADADVDADTAAHDEPGGAVAALLAMANDVTMQAEAEADLSTRPTDELINALSDDDFFCAQYGGGGTVGTRLGRDGDAAEGAGGC